MGRALLRSLLRRKISRQQPRGDHLQLPVHAKPTLDELTKVINELSSGKSPGNDRIPAEILKENRNVLLPYLYKLLIICWRQGAIPHDTSDAKKVTLYKNKGDKGDCDNYRGISLLSITEKPSHKSS